eukprot:373542_1
MSYTWNITDQTVITQIQTAKPGQQFKSPVFCMFNFRWYLELFPNGSSDKSVGKTQIYLTLVALSKKVESIRINRKYTLVELGAVSEAVHTLTHEKIYALSWPANTVSAPELQKCRQFTLKVDVDLHAVFDQDDND